MHYQQDAPGDWGQMQAAPEISVATEELVTADNCKLFLRSWKTNGDKVLLILHGLGGQSAWYIDMGNVLASRGISVYAMDHRGFGHSSGLRGHIDDYHTYVEDIAFVLREIRKRHPEAGISLLGHSMGGIFAAYTAAKYGNMLTGVTFLNPWIEDPSRVSLTTTLSILLGGMLKSKRSWQVAGGTETMTANSEAIQMLQADPLWQRTQTATFLFQIFQMRSAVLKQAKNITIPALVMQAEEDKAILPEAAHKFYETLASSDKTWKTCAGYWHDSEFESDRSQMDAELAAWINQHAVSPSGATSA